MGVTIKSKEHSVDIGYSDFWRLRRKLASLCDTKFGELYSFMTTPCQKISNQCEMDYDTELHKLSQKHGKRRMLYFENFLWQPDCDGTATYGTCRYILQLLENEDDNEIIGYPGWGDRAPRMKDFKRILQDCVESKYNMRWY